MNEETRKTLNLAGILWIVFSIGASLPWELMTSFGFGYLAFGSFVLGFLFRLISVTSFVSLPGLITIILVNKKVKNWIKEKKIYSIILGIILLFFVIFGLRFSLNLVMLSLFLVFLIYIALWLIPVKYPVIRPLLVSSTIGFIVFIWFIPLSVFIYWLLFVKDVYNPDALIWVGLPIIILPGLAIIMGISIIVGIILSVLKSKKKQ